MADAHDCTPHDRGQGLPADDMAQSKQQSHFLPRTKPDTLTVSPANDPVNGPAEPAYGTSAREAPPTAYQGDSGPTMWSQGLAAPIQGLSQSLGEIQEVVDMVPSYTLQCQASAVLMPRGRGYRSLQRGCLAPDINRTHTRCDCPRGSDIWLQHPV